MNTEILIYRKDPDHLTHNCVGVYMDRITIDGVTHIMSWYETGMPRSYATYDDTDDAIGVSIEWDRDGSIREYYFHKEGIPHGEYWSWDSEGNIESKVILNKGEKVADSNEITREDKSFLSMQYGQLHFVDETQVKDFKNEPIIEN